MPYKRKDHFNILLVPDDTTFDSMLRISRMITDTWDSNPSPTKGRGIFSAKFSENGNEIFN